MGGEGNKLARGGGGEGNKLSMGGRGTRVQVRLNIGQLWDL